MKMKPLSFVIGILLADSVLANDHTVVNSVTNTTNNSVVIINCAAPQAVTGEVVQSSVGPSEICPPGGGGGHPPPAPPPPAPPAIYNISVPFGTPGDVCNAPDFCGLDWPQPDANTLTEINAAVANWEAAHPGQHLGPGSTVTICTPAGCTTYKLDNSDHWGQGVFTPQHTSPPYYPPPPPPPPAPPYYPPAPPPDDPPDPPPGNVGPIEPVPPPCTPDHDGSPCIQPE